MIEFPRACYDRIVAHATDGSPMEVCGVLGGEHGEDGSRVASVHRAENAAETPETEYLIDPPEQLELLETIEDAGRDVVGFYHSHPAGPAQPSETDVARAAWPGLSYPIVDLAGRHPYVGSWRWREDTGSFRQELVRIL